MIEIHQEAIKNFDKKGSSLLLHIKPYNAPGQPQSNFSPDIIIKHKISEKEIIDFKPIELVNGFGEITGFYFRNNNQDFGIFNDEYKNLLRLAEAISNTNNIKNVISKNTIRKIIQDWVVSKYNKNETTELVAYLINKSENLIKIQEYWVPINFLHVQSPFMVGKIEFRPITEALVNNIEKTLTSDTMQNHDEVKDFLDKTIRDYQGHAAAVMTIEAEPDQAHNTILDEAEKSLLAIRIFTSGAMHPKITAPFDVWGCEYTPATNVFSLDGNCSFHLNSSTKGLPPRRAILDNKTIEDNMSSGLFLISQLLKNSPKNSFQEQVLNSLLIYGRCATSIDISNKLLYVVSALESLFLRNNNEPIQQNLSERIAFLIGNNYSNRKKIIKEIKDGYAIRSAFLHHGATIDDYDVLEKFMWNAWQAIIGVISNINNFTTKIDFLDKLDEMKLS